jgi:hypothetical protein
VPCPTCNLQPYGSFSSLCCPFLSLNRVAQSLQVSVPLD